VPGLIGFLAVAAVIERRDRGPGLVQLHDLNA